MEGQLFKSLVDLLTHDSLSSKLLDVMSILEEQRVLMYMMRDAENEASPTRANSKLLLKKWNTSLLDLLRTGDASTRYSAISLLRETIRVSNYDTILSNFTIWQETLSSLTKKEKCTDVLAGLILTIGSFLHRSLNWIDLKRDMHKSSLVLFMPTLLRAVDNEPAYRDEALLVLALCLRHFPLSLKTQHASIKQLCWKLMSNHSYETRHKAALVLSLLPFNTESWSSLMAELLSHLRGLVIVAYKGLISDDDLLDGEEEDADIPVKKACALPSFMAKLEAYSSCLMMLMNKSTDFAITFPIQQLLKLIVVIFQVDGSTMISGAESCFSVLELYKIIPALHILGYNILICALDTMKASLFPYQRVIVELMISELNVGSQASCLPLYSSAIRALQYKVCRRCIQTFGSCMAFSLVKSLISHAKADANLYQDYEAGNTVNVKTGKQPKGGKRKRTQKAAQMSVVTIDTIQTSAMDFTSYSATPLDVQKRAIKVFCDILEYTGDTLSTENRSEIDKTILQLSLALYNSPSLSLSSTFMAPFSEDGYRKIVYSALLKSVVSPSRSLTQAPTLPYALKFFGFGINDPSRKIAKQCKEALSLISLSLHSASPPIHPPTRKLDNESFFHPLPVTQVLTRPAQQQQQQDEYESEEEKPRKKEKKQKKRRIESSEEEEEMQVEDKEEKTAKPIAFPSFPTQNNQTSTATPSSFPSFPSFTSQTPSFPQTTTTTNTPVPTPEAPTQTTAPVVPTNTEETKTKTQTTDFDMGFPEIVDDAPDSDSDSDEESDEDSE